MVSKKDAEDFPAYPVYADSISPALAASVRPKNEGKVLQAALNPELTFPFGLAERFHCLQVT